MDNTLYNILTKLAAGHWSDSEDAYHQEFKKRMTSGMGYSGADVHGLLLNEISQRTGIPVSQLEAQYGKWSDNAIMRHNGNAINKFQKANKSDAAYVDSVLDGDFESAQRQLGLWSRNDAARAAENLRRLQYRNGTMQGRVKAMNARAIQNKYNSSQWGPAARKARKAQAAAAPVAPVQNEFADAPDPYSPEYTLYMIAKGKQHNLRQQARQNRAIRSSKAGLRKRASWSALEDYLNRKLQ